MSQLAGPLPGRQNYSVSSMADYQGDGCDVVTPVNARIISFLLQDAG